MIRALLAQNILETFQKHFKTLKTFKKIILKCLRNVLKADMKIVLC